MTSFKAFCVWKWGGEGGRGGGKGRGKGKEREKRKGERKDSYSRIPMAEQQTVTSRTNVTNIASLYSDHSL
jgi:hypothetical protein